MSASLRHWYTIVTVIFFNHRDEMIERFPVRIA